MVASSALTPDDIKQELKRLRQGLALARPSVTLQLSRPLRVLLAGDDESNAHALLNALRQAIAELDHHERRYAEADFNLAAEHGHATLTARQESLAQSARCALKTVRRRADKALDSLAVLLADTGRNTAPKHDEPPHSPAGWRDEIQALWKASEASRVDIVCSEIPPEEQPYFAAPSDRNYLRYAKFADLDSLIYVRTGLTQAFPDISIRDFSPSEHYDTESDTLVVIGGPPWNAKFREFLPQLPFYFEPHPLGQDDPLVVPLLDNADLGPHWTPHGELLEDVAVFTRLSLSQGTVVFLLAGCLTLGVLGAAHCFLHRRIGAHNARYVSDLVGDDDFVLVTEARRVGTITDTPDLTAVPPLLLLTRTNAEPFKVLTDNTKRYASLRYRSQP